jgi:signal transduction histidine kinase
MQNGEKRDPLERNSTDEGIRSERLKTDQEITSRSQAQRDVASDVVAEARHKADAVLSNARDREDLKPTTADSKLDVRAARAREDAVLEVARRGADVAAGDENDRRHIALASLLAFERQYTDHSLESERKRADRALTSRDDFMAMVTHDLRGLLGGIALSAELLKELGAGEGHTRVVGYAEKIQRFTARMTRLVGDLMDVSSIEAGKLSMVRVPRNAVLLLRDSMDAFAPAAAASGIVFACESAVYPGMVELDHERILQVLTNLVGNALKFTPRGGKITVTMDRRGEDICFAVTDTGEGVPSALHQKIFERYFQSNDAGRRGLGLGLFISKSIVESHGGKLWVESTPGTGSTFRFTVPAGERPGAAH